MNIIDNVVSFAIGFAPAYIVLETFVKPGVNILAAGIFDTNKYGPDDNPLLGYRGPKTSEGQFVGDPTVKTQVKENICRCPDGFSAKGGNHCENDSGVKSSSDVMPCLAGLQPEETLAGPPGSSFLDPSGKVIRSASIPQISE